MKVILGPIIGQASGKLGGLVMSHNRGGTYARRRAHPTIVTSDPALDAKARFSTASAYWGGLTEQVREAWSLWAANNPIVDRVGNKITLDGHAAYVRCNSMRGYLFGGVLMTGPPVDPAPVPLTSLSLAVTAVTYAIQIVYTPTPCVEPHRLMIWGGVTTSPARKYMKGSYKLCGLTDAAEVSPLQIKSMLQNRLGTIQVGDYVHVQVATYDFLSGLKGQPLTASIQVI